MYQVEILFAGGLIDTATNGGIGTVIGPNGENESTLETAGWSFNCPTTSRITIGRPAGFRVQPLVNILTHGNNSGNVVTKAPNGTSSAAYSAIQTLSGASWTQLDVYSLNNTNTGIATSGATSCWVTFGLIA